jgi:S-adenosyl methyltransferase
VTSDWRADLARLQKAALIDTTRPKAVRVADFLDGGGDNFEADRKAARALIATSPVIAMIAPAWRGFTRRVLRYLVREAGVRQFLFVGMTMTAANAHDVVWSEDPDCRIVLADDDPLVVAHARAHMRPNGDDGHGAVGVVPVGLRDPGAIIAGARATLDFGQPIAVVLFFVLAFVDDTAAAAHIVAELADALPSGGYVALHHLTGDPDPALAAAARRWNQQSPQKITLRSRAAVESLVAGLEPVDPGLVLIDDWRPSPGAPEAPGAPRAVPGAPGAPDAPGAPRAAPVIPLYGVVARKPLTRAARPPRAGRGGRPRRGSGPRPRSGTDASSLISVRGRRQARRSGPRNRAAAARRRSSRR